MAGLAGGAVLLVVCLAFGCGVRDRERVLLPAEYKGCVYVVYGETCGDEERHLGARVLRIPEDGILVSAFEYQSGLIRRDYFQIDDRGEELEMSDDMVAGGVSSVVQTDPSGASLRFEEFYVGPAMTNAGCPEAPEGDEQRIWAAVEECRGSSTGKR